MDRNLVENGKAKSKKAVKRKASFTIRAIRVYVCISQLGRVVKIFKKPIK